MSDRECLLSGSRLWTTIKLNMHSIDTMTNSCKSQICLNSIYNSVYIYMYQHILNTFKYTIFIQILSWLVVSWASTDTHLPRLSDGEIQLLPEAHLLRMEMEHLRRKSMVKYQPSGKIYGKIYGNLYHLNMFKKKNVKSTIYRTLSDRMSWSSSDIVANQKPTLEEWWI